MMLMHSGYFPGEVTGGWTAIASTEQNRTENNLILKSDMTNLRSTIEYNAQNDALKPRN